VRILSCGDLWLVFEKRLKVLLEEQQNLWKRTAAISTAEFVGVQQTVSGMMIYAEPENRE